RRYREVLSAAGLLHGSTDSLPTVEELKAAVLAAMPAPSLPAQQVSAIECGTEPRWRRPACARAPSAPRPGRGRERGLRGVIVYRLLTFPVHPAQLPMGTLRVRFGTMVVSTTLRFAPAVALDVFLGGELWTWVVG